MTVDLSKKEMEVAIAEFLGESVTALPSERLHRLITLSQFYTDTILAEIERRGDLTFSENGPVVPYYSGHFVETVLTREGIEEDDAERPRPN